MHGHDGDGLIGDERLELTDVNGIVSRVDIAEHGGAAAADDRVRGGGKGERRSDDLALELHGLDDIFEREVAIREQGDIGHTEVLLQLRFEPLVLFTHIGEPMAVPNAADLIAVLLKLRDGRAGDIDYFGHILLQSAADAATRKLSAVILAQRLDRRGDNDEHQHRQRQADEYRKHLHGAEAADLEQHKGDDAYDGCPEHTAPAGRLSVAVGMDIGRLRGDIGAGVDGRCHEHEAQDRDDDHHKLGAGHGLKYGEDRGGLAGALEHGGDIGDAAGLDLDGVIAESGHCDPAAERAPDHLPQRNLAQGAPLGHACVEHAHERHIHDEPRPVPHRPCADKLPVAVGIGIGDEVDKVLDVQAEGVDLGAENVEHTSEHADEEHERKGEIDVDVAEVLDALLQAEIDAGAEHGDPDGEDDYLKRLYIFIRDAEDTLQQQGQQRHTETH